LCSQGYIAANSAETLTVKLLPGTPASFRHSFRVQVAHFQPDIVTVSGEGVFPRISLDLPRHTDDDSYRAFYQVPTAGCGLCVCVCVCVC
jgi:hydrocephalus-inducing protein